MADRHEWFLNQIFRHREDLRRYLQQFTSGAEDIEDLIQETYVRVYSLPNIEAIDSPKAYLFTIARNLAVERARRNTCHATDSVADFAPLNLHAMETGVDMQVDAQQKYESLCLAIDSLPPVCRRVFVLRKLYKLSHNEIAEVLGIAHSTIEKHVVKGLMRCRDYFRQRGMFDNHTSAATSEVSPLRGRHRGEAP